MVVAALVAADLLRTDSLLRGVWNELFGPRTYLRRFLDGFRSRGPGWSP